MSFNTCIHFRYWILVFINALLAYISVILVHISVLLVSYWCTMSVPPGVSMRRTVMVLSRLPLNCAECGPLIATRAYSKAVVSQWPS